VLDTVVYTVLVSLGVRVLFASIIGGLCGSTFAFLTSSRFVFASRGQGLPIRLVLYLLYVVCIVLVAGALTEAVTVLLLHLASGLGLNLPLTPAAFLAKCVVTPFLLLTNFFVARAMLKGS